MQERRNSRALAMELCLSCTKPPTSSVCWDATLDALLLHRQFNSSSPGCTCMCQCYYWMSPVRHQAITSWNDDNLLPNGHLWIFCSDYFHRTHHMPYKDDVGVNLDSLKVSEDAVSSLHWEAVMVRRFSGDNVGKWVISYYLDMSKALFRKYSCQ